MAFGDTNFGRGKPCFSGDTVARLYRPNETETSQLVLQFGTVIRAPKKHGRVFNSSCEKDIGWNPSVIPIPCVSCSAANDIFLLDRPVRKGSRISRRGRVGNVINVITSATLESIDKKSVFSHVLIEDLSEQSVLLGCDFKGAPICLQNHIGLLQTVTLQVSIRFPCGSSGRFKLIQDENPTKISVGDEIHLSKERLQNVKWDTIGSVRPCGIDVAVAAMIFRVEAVAVRVSWEAQVPMDSPESVPPQIIEGSSLGQLKTIKDAPSRIRQYFQQIGTSLPLLMTIKPDHRRDRADKWKADFLAAILSRDLANDEENANSADDVSIGANNADDVSIGANIAVVPLFTQSKLVVRWVDDSTEEELNSIEVEIVDGPEATFVGRLNSSNKDASYGIVFHMRPEELGKFPERSVNVLWFVDLKNDRLDAAVRVLRLQHEVVQSKDLLVLNEMQKILHPARIIVRRDSQDDFHAGVFESMSPDGKIEIWGFDGKSYFRWPTLVADVCRARVTLEGNEYFAKESTDTDSGGGFGEIYYDAVDDFIEDFPR